MADSIDSGEDDLARDQAKVLLQSWTPFARLSRRLLTDLLDRTEIVHLSNVEAAQGTAQQPTRTVKHSFEEEVLDPLFGFVVLDGEVDVGTSGLWPSSVGVGAWRRSDIKGVDDKPMSLRKKVGRAGAKGVRHETARVALLKASSVTPELAWSLQLHKMTTGTRRGADAMRKLCRPELIWCDTDLESRAHLEPLVHLLAGAIARDLHEPTAVVKLGSETIGTGVLLHPRRVRGLPAFEKPPVQSKLPEARRPFDVHQLRSFGMSDAENPATAPRKLGATTRVFRVAGERDENRGHVLVFDPDHAGGRPGALASGVTFDRIVHLTAEVPREVPGHLRVLLDPGVFDQDDPAPYYTSFIASVPVARDVRRRGGRGRPFVARAIRFAQRIERRQQYEYLDRLQRDACVVAVDLDTLATAWERHSRAPGSTPFIDAASDKGISDESLSRWARAVTNRRVGIALSGGGACAYRAGPLLQSLQGAGVPVDVFAGLSGGALVGAFYAHSGLDGFNRVVALGPFIQLTAPIAMATTWLLQAVVDRVLGGTRVEDLEVRFAAVAVALPPDAPPMTEVVVNGTLGEAVRVSGSLPPVFAKTVKGGMRFTDGGAGTIVPSQVARDFGADIVLACNAIPGPARSNPLPPWTRLPLTILIPGLQRSIDYMAWHSYFWRQASQRFLREADVALEFEPLDISMMEAGQWMYSSTIVDRARQMEPQIEQVVAQLLKEWRQLGDRPGLQKLLIRAARAARRRRAAAPAAGARGRRGTARPRSRRGKK